MTSSKPSFNGAAEKSDLAFFSIRTFFALISGILLSLAFVKELYGCFAWIAIIPLLFAIQNISFGKSFRLGFIAGLFHFFSLLYWLIDTMRLYGGLPLFASIPVFFLLSSYLAIYTALFSACASIIISKRSFFATLFLIPALWTSLEYLRSVAYILGFSWGAIGYSQVFFTHIIQISDIFGVYGVSFLIMLVNAALFFIFGLIYDKPVIKKKILYASIVIITSLAFTLLYGNRQIRLIDTDIAKADKKKIAIVQGNIDQTIKWNKNFIEQIIKKYINLSLSLKKDKPELIVWPETAVPYLPKLEIGLIKSIRECANQTEAYFLIGSHGITIEKERDFLLNSAYIMNPDGNISARYDKSHLVPFGEYVPFGDWLPFIKKIVVGDHDFMPGEKGKTIKWNNCNLGIQICFETIFPEIAGKMAKNNADIFLNITNDTWFGNSDAPYRHFEIAVFRAVENKKSLVRSANSGISGAIDPLGRIIATTPLFEEAAETYTVPILKKKTLYARCGDFFAIICIAVSFISLLFFRFFRFFSLTSYK